jgi:hypothetical protein
MADTPTYCGCVTCPVLRPDAEPRQPHRPPVCDGDRRLIDRHLTDLGYLVADLTNPEPPIVDRDRYERLGVQYLTGGRREVVSLGEAWRDPLAAVGGVAPINSRRTGPSVSGSRERPLPVSADRLDLIAPARGTNLTDAAREHPQDHGGHLAVATLLDGWARSWRDHLCPGHHLPPATVDELVGWLRLWLGDACDRYPELPLFAEEIRDARRALRGLAGEIDPPPEPCDGVSCARCGMRALFRRPGDIYRAECSQCGTLYTEDEYVTLVGEQAAAVRRRRELAEAPPS